MKSLYIGNGISFIVKELKVVSVSGEPFNAYFELQNGILSYISDKELSIITQYDLKKQIINDSFGLSGRFILSVLYKRKIEL